MKSKRQSKNADQINREEELEAGENNKGDERLPLCQRNANGWVNLTL